MTLGDFSLAGKTAVVTGGARGLGLEMMRALAEAGAATASIDLLLQGEEEARAITRDYGVRAAAYIADVTDAAQVAATMAAVERDLGSIDILVAAAGVAQNVAAEDVDPVAWRRVIDINLTGVFLCTQSVAKGMIARGGGSIILIASMSGLIVNRPQKQTAYNVSKAGVIMMAKSLAAEWAEHGVRVNAIAPGYMRTALTDQVLAGQDGLQQAWESYIPMGRMGVPEELRGTVVYLASAASSYVTGHALVVDGGYTAW